MLMNTVSSLQRIERLSESVPPWALTGLQGRYHWQLQTGHVLTTLDVTDTLCWTAPGADSTPRATILMSEATFHELANKVADPLTLFNTGKLSIVAHAVDQNVEINVMKLLNLIFNSAIVDRQRILELETRSVQGKDFTTCHTVDSEDDIQSYLIRGEPVIVKNACVMWPIFNMSVAQIVEKVGALDVSILIEEYDLENGHPPKYEKASFAEYVDSLHAPASAVHGYMAANTVPPTLEDTYLFPNAFERDVFNIPRWWIGPANTGLRLHRDMVDNFLVQLKGHKKISVYAPSETRFLYPTTIGGNLMYEPSRVDPECYAADKFPDFKQAAYTVCELEPGDMLYLPAGWWHHVVNLEVSWSLNFFAVNGEPRVLSFNRGN